MLTLSALLFASAVAAPPRYYWERPKPEPAKERATEQRKPPEPPKPPPLCKKFPRACTPELLLGPPDDYEHGGPDMGGGSGGF